MKNPFRPKYPDLVVCMNIIMPAWVYRDFYGDEIPCVPATEQDKEKYKNNHNKKSNL